MGDEGFVSRHWLQITLGILAIAAILFALYFTLYQPVNCDSYACFQDKMTVCSKATYINEEPEASWKYEILGSEGNDCTIQVTMLQAKKGELQLENLAGMGMQCNYPKGIITYPEKDLGACSGKLKEELQGIVIKKLYTYILDNLGELDQGLKQFV
ncbi:MAG TPA: hypothetical protein VHA12_03380 [Candidatus Nanoarchaeia archaeon]|nr:hypothetical protein [Candidatus Nanoarchaeia archaeon]